MMNEIKLIAESYKFIETVQIKYYEIANIQTIQERCSKFENNSTACSNYIM
jgi:hypothetical protein